MATGGRNATAINVVANGQHVSAAEEAVWRSWHRMAAVAIIMACVYVAILA